MMTTVKRLPNSDLFDGVTPKQREVLELLAENRTTKEIAARLGVSDSAVNQRIEPLRQRLGGITRSELTRRYRDCASLAGRNRPCEILTGEKTQVATPDSVGQVRNRDDRPGHFRFEDSMSFPHELPWNGRTELRIVPRLLDGKHAWLARGITMLLMLLLIVACLVLGLTAARVLTDELGKGRPGTEMSK
jgi:DNA-binding CsgD family transcriptional regulator